MADYITGSHYTLQAYNGDMVCIYDAYDLVDNLVHTKPESLSSIYSVLLHLVVSIRLVPGCLEGFMSRNTYYVKRLINGSVCHMSMVLHSMWFKIKSSPDWANAFIHHLP